MQSKDAFSACHPAVSFAYFAAVLLFSAFLMHPACLLLSAWSAFAYALYLQGRRALHRTLRCILPMQAAAVLINPAFCHEGATILCYLPSGNPLTKESIFYGLAAAFMLCAVLLWFSCFNCVISSDKFVYLFGRIIPALSLVLSMTLRFVPRFRRGFEECADAQRSLGRDISSGSPLHRLGIAFSVLSAMVTRSFEESVQTADSMKSRGYGLRGRTAFSIYRFTRHDRTLLLLILLCCSVCAAAFGPGGLHFRWFPTVKAVGNPMLWSAALLFYALLCFLPLLCDLKEDAVWKHIRSKI